MDSRQRADLDNWITGHGGEDQFRDDDQRDDELPPCGCDWTSRCAAHAYLDQRDDDPVLDDTNSYVCPRCQRDGLGRHPFTVPPCDPISRPEW